MKKMMVFLLLLIRVGMVEVLEGRWRNVSAERCGCRDIELVVR
jgi:hypothetical protein